jgi:hypothetical protein
MTKRGQSLKGYFGGSGGARNGKNNPPARRIITHLLRPAACVISGSSVLCQGKGGGHEGVSH